jgi:hypothetical protein
MAAPTLELDNIFTRLAETIRSTIMSIRDEIVTGRGTGVPDNVTIQRLLEQRSLGKGAVNGAIKRIGDQAFGRVRQAYATIQPELAAGMEVPEALSTALPEEKGFTVDHNDLADEVYNLGEPETNEIFRNALKKSAAELGNQSLEDKMQADQDKRDAVRMIWVTAFKRSCADCIALASQVKTLLEWKESGFYPGNGNTSCGERCMCHLAPVNRIAYRFNLLKVGQEADEETEAKLQEMLANGVRLQQKKIDLEEKAYGKPYASSTITSKVGQIRSDKYNPNFEDKESVMLTKSPTDKTPSYQSFKKRLNEDEIS